jgi:hypothetical protein
VLKVNRAVRPMLMVLGCFPRGRVAKPFLHGQRNEQDAARGPALTAHTRCTKDVATPTFILSTR